MKLELSEDERAGVIRALSEFIALYRGWDALRKKMAYVPVAEGFDDFLIEDEEDYERRVTARHNGVIIVLSRLINVNELVETGDA